MAVLTKSKEKVEEIRFKELVKKGLELIIPYCCGKEFFYAKGQSPNYCPSCGAKMELIQRLAA